MYAAVITFRYSKQYAVSISETASEEDLHAAIAFRNRAVPRRRDHPNRFICRVRRTWLFPDALRHMPRRRWPGHQGEHPAAGSRAEGKSVRGERQSRGAAHAHPQGPIGTEAPL